METGAPIDCTSGTAGEVRFCGAVDEVAAVCLAAFRTICLKYFPYNAERPFLCCVMVPIRSRTPAASSMSFRILGAKVEPPEVYALRVNAKQAANEIIMAVLFGMECNWASPWMAALITFKADDKPAVRKNRLTSMGAVG